MHRQFAGFALGLTIGTLGVLLQLTNWGGEIEESVGLYWLFHLRGPAQPPDDVIVVAIDKPSSDKLGLSAKPSEWPRNVHDWGWSTYTLSRVAFRLARFWPAISG